MEENETIAIFNTKLMGIANQAFELGKRYSDEKLVRKPLRSLPNRFEAKIVVIKEVRDITTTRLDGFSPSLWSELETRKKN